jgi:superfamily II DNA helicase RecQ
MIAAEFEYHGRESKLHIIFAIEALGIGVNLPDIQHTILWHIPRGKEPAIAWQHGGCASRDKLDSEIILFIES